MNLLEEELTAYVRFEERMLYRELLAVARARNLREIDRSFREINYSDGNWKDGFWLSGDFF